MPKIKLSEIKPNPDNPRVIKDNSFAKLVNSIKEFPKMMELRPMVIDKNGVVLGGNMRLRALQEIGYEEIPENWVKRADKLTNKEKERFVIADNRPFGEWDFEILANCFDVPDLIEWGFEEWELGIEEGDEGGTGGETDPDAIPDTPEDPKSKPGVIYQLGEHRLMCGDCTDAENVTALMGGEKAEISITSPPYNTKENAKLSPHQDNGTKYNNYSDDLCDADYLDMLVSSTKLALSCSEYVFINIQSLSGNKIVLIDFLSEMAEVYADTLIWQKGNAQPAMAENVLNSQFEYVHCFSNKANRSIGTKRFRGTISNVIEIGKQSCNEITSHNATFPVEFAEFFVSNFCETSVVDLFCGSGTTMIACEKIGRKLYGMEIDSTYCDVIRRRWAEFVHGEGCDWEKLTPEVGKNSD